MLAVRVGLSALLVLPVACFGNLDPIENDPEEAGVSIEVADCTIDEVTGNAALVYRITSDKDYQTILVDGKIKDAEGTVVDTSSGSATNVVAGEPVEQEMVLNPPEDIGDDFTCEATLNFAQERIDL